MIRGEQNIKNGILNQIIPKNKMNINMKNFENNSANNGQNNGQNSAKIDEIDVLSPTELDTATIAKSYINIKKYCTPWPKCVLTN